MSQNESDIGKEVETTISEQPTLFDKGKKAVKNIFYGLLLKSIALGATSCGNDLELASKDGGRVYFNSDASIVKYEKNVGRTSKTFYFHGPGAIDNRVNFDDYDLTKIKINPRGPFNKKTYKTSKGHIVHDNKIKKYQAPIRQELARKQYFNFRYR